MMVVGDGSVSPGSRVQKTLPEAGNNGSGEMRLL